MKMLSLGLVLGIFMLETIGAMLAGWSLWVHRVGVDANRLDAIYAATSIAVLIIAPILSILAFALEHTFPRHFFYANALGISSVVVRLVVMTLSLTIDLMPWTAKILSGKRSDVIAGFGAAIVWLGIVHFSRKRLRQRVDPT